MSEKTKDRSIVIEHQLGIFPKDFFDVGDGDLLAEEIKKQMSLSLGFMKNILPPGNVPRVMVGLSTGEIEVQISPEKMNLIFRSVDGQSSISIEDFKDRVQKFINTKSLKDIGVARIGFVTQNIIFVKDNFKSYATKLYSNKLNSDVINLGGFIDYRFMEDGEERMMRITTTAVQNALSEEKAVNLQTDISTSDKEKLSISLSDIMQKLEQLIASKSLKDKSEVLGV
jgi:hypothetical protein